MSLNTSTSNFSDTGSSMPMTGGFRYKTIAIYENFSDVVDRLALLHNEGFTYDQISLLGREQENWEERIDQEWTALNTAKGTLGGAALGSIPGLVLVTGVVLTGGAGVLVAGPMAAALAAFGMGAVGGSLMGGAAINVDEEDKDKIMDIGEQVQSAIGHGKWVIVAHSYNQAEARQLERLLPDSRTIGEDEASDKI